MAGEADAAGAFEEAGCAAAGRYAFRSAKTATGAHRTMLLAMGFFKKLTLLTCLGLFYAIPGPFAMIHSDYLLCFVRGGAGSRSGNNQKTKFIANWMIRGSPASRPLLPLISLRICPNVEELSEPVGTEGFR